MKVKILFLGIGIVIGYMLHQPEERKPIADETPREAAKGVVADKAAVEQPQAQSLPLQMATNPVRKIAMKKPPKQKITFVLDERSIGEFEENWDDLRNQAHATWKNDGWEFHLLKNNSLFAKAGFQEGDFVSYDTLMAGFDGPNGQELASRIAGIFNQITY